MDTLPTSPSSPPSAALPQMTGWMAPEDEEEELLDDQAEEQPRPSRSKWKTAFVLLITLSVGAAAGSLLTRQRYKAQQVVASVNGVLIKEPDFLHEMEKSQGDAVLKKMISEELQLQYARKLGVYPTEAEVQAKYKPLSEQPNFGQYLASTHQGPEDIFHSLRVSLAQAAILNKGNEVSDAEIRAYYDQQADKRNTQAKFYTPPSVTISVIINRSQEEAKKAARELAKGESFASVAAKYSQDSSKNNGGVLPPVLRGRTPSSRIPGADDAVFSLGLGEQLGPIKLADQWWIIRCLEKKPESLKAFEEVKAECREGALLQKSLTKSAQQVHNDYVKFEKNASIYAFWPRYRYVIGDR